MGERLEVGPIVITEEIMGIWAEEVASIEREITRLNARSDTYRKKIDAARVLLAAQSVETRPANPRRE